MWVAASARSALEASVFIAIGVGPLRAPDRDDVRSSIRCMSFVFQVRLFSRNCKVTQPNLDYQISYFIAF